MLYFYERILAPKFGWKSILPNSQPPASVTDTSAGASVAKVFGGSNIFLYGIGALVAFFLWQGAKK